MRGRRMGQRMFDLYDRAAKQFGVAVHVAVEVGATELAIGHVVVALAAVFDSHEFISILGQW